MIFMENVDRKSDGLLIYFIRIFIINQFLIRLSPLKLNMVLIQIRFLNKY